MQEEDEGIDDQQNNPSQGVQMSSWKYTFELVYLVPCREKQADGEVQFSFPIIVWYQYLYWLDDNDEDDVKGYDDDDDDK